MVANLEAAMVLVERLDLVGIGRNQGALEVETLHQGRDGGDLVGFFIDRLLSPCRRMAQHQPAVGREGRHQMQQTALTSFRRPAISTYLSCLISN